MKSTFTSREKNEVKFTMEFTKEELEKAIGEAYLKERVKFPIDGFRKGKAPRKLIETKYGEGVFLEEGIDVLFSHSYPVAVKELGIKPVDRPSVNLENFEKEKDLVIGVTVTVTPEFEVKDYKGVEVDKISHDISDLAVQLELESLQKRNSRLVLVERPAQDKDTVLIDYSGSVDGVLFDGGAAERQPLTLGSNTFIPGFEEQIVGASVGDEIDVKVTFPEEYHSEDLAGKEAVFKVKVHEIKEAQVPDINDEFAKDVSEFETLEELKNDTLSKLTAAAASKAELETKNAILEKIYNANEIDIPEIMIDEQIDEMMEEFDQQLKYQGLDLKKYFEYLGKEEKDFRTEIQPEAFKKIKTRLLVSAIADAEKFDVSDEEIEKEIEEMAKQYKMEIEQLKKAMQAENYGYLVKDIKMRKAIEFITNNAVIK
ncbi:MAG: trigger factor [Eubacteriales bacterium]